MAERLLQSIESTTISLFLLRTNVTVALISCTTVKPGFTRSVAISSDVVSDFTMGSTSPAWSADCYPSFWATKNTFTFFIIIRFKWLIYKEDDSFVSIVTHSLPI